MSTLNPPELAEKVTNHGFTKAAGVRVVHLEPGKVELALPAGTICCNSPGTSTAASSPHSRIRLPALP